MAKVRYLLGETKSVSGSLVDIVAEKESIFGITELTSETVKPNTLEWVLADQNKKEIHKVTEDWNGKFIVKFDKKTSGVYKYFLQASYIDQKSNAKKNVNGIWISGYCDPSILSLSWKSDGNEGENKLRAGDTLTVDIEEEGLNGNRVTLEIYKKENGKLKKVESITSTCVEEKVAFFVTGASTFKWIPIDPKKKEKEIEAELVLKLKDNESKKYVPFNKKEEITEIKIVQKNIVPSKAKAPENKTVSVVKMPSTDNPEVNGILDLVKLKVPDTVTGGKVVCNDYILTQGDTSNHWILFDGGRYHWLKNRAGADQSKPLILPITFPSSVTFKLEATFNCLLDIKEDVHIRAKDTKDYFKFKIQKRAGLTKGAEIRVEFEDTKKEKKIAYFKDKRFEFHYSFDQKTWIPLGNAIFELYVTKSSPTYVYDEMQESLLFLTCKPCHGKTNTIGDEALLDNIFKEFTDRKVFRRREQKDNSKPGGGEFLPAAHRFSKIGMGYWRGISTAADNFSSIGGRPYGGTWAGDTILLKYGEARCGEWTDLLGFLLQSQGISAGISDEAICTSHAINKEGYPYRRRTATSSLYTFLTPPTGNAYSTIFAVKNAKLNDITNPNSFEGKSPAQGTDQAQELFIDHIWFYRSSSGRFFDPSYGKKYSRSNSNLKKYCSDNISSVFVSELAGTPLAITPNNRIEKGDKIVEYIYADKGIGL